MSDNTKIQWCDSTYNPWRGCSNVGAGCQSCYAERMGKRFGVEWGPGRPRVQSSEATRNAPLRWNRRPQWCRKCETSEYTLSACCRHCGGELHRRRVFLGSMMDILDPEVPAEWLASALDVVRRTPELDWLLLSKRWELFDRRLLDAQLWLIDHCKTAAPFERRHDYAATAAWLAYWRPGSITPKNVTIFTSIEDQRSAEERIQHLLRVPAARHGLSIEPLLGSVDLTRVRWRTQNDHHGKPQPDHYENVLVGGGVVDVPKIDQVIVGGETGPGARPCSVEWIRGIVQQCAGAGVTCYVKQLGCRPERDGVGVHYNMRDRKGADPSEWPEDLRVRQWMEERKP